MRAIEDRRQNNGEDEGSTPWVDSAFPDKPHRSTPRFDVVVREVELRDGPATIHYEVSVGSLQFCSTISYDSVPGWDSITLPPHVLNRLVGVVIAWDAMRFLALGGERLILPSDLALTNETATTWRLCFLKQFGEWRYRNRFEYRDADMPLAESSDSPSGIQQIERVAESAEASTEQRWLLTNGGSKDTLAGMLILNQLGIPYDLYEGRLPFGGTVELQGELLRELGVKVAPKAATVGVTVIDDFYDRPFSDFHEAGIEVDYFKTDFAVGHTANYAGFFPLIMFHGYNRMWMNVERSADDSDIIWNGEQINHEWCKSSEYRLIMGDLYAAITGANDFDGFESTLSGLHDTAIYEMLARRPELLLKTHSCNYGKPWCARCPKCCFCYLMMTAALGEDYAMKLLGVDYSLFDAAELQQTWQLLLDPDLVAWECVASKDECALALGKCAERRSLAPFLSRYVPSSSELVEFETRFTAVAWDAIPDVLTEPIRRLVEQP